MQRRLAAWAFVAATTWTAVANAGVVLQPGDLVLVDSFAYPSPTPAVWRLDPASLDTTRIGSGGLLVHPDRVAVDDAGHVIVADRVSGLVSIDPATGGQTLLVASADLGGRAARGVCRDPAGGVVFTAVGATSQILHYDFGSHQVRVVTQGGVLVEPGGLTFGPDGALYVADGSIAIGGGTGAIVRVTPAGAQSLVLTTGMALISPFDIAITPDGWAWTAQWGGLSRRGGGFLRTRLSDGLTESTGGDRSQGVAINGAGVVFLGDCISISLDCYSGYRYLDVYPEAAKTYLPAGGMAVVPSVLTPTRRSTWGSLKTRYR